MLRHSKRLSKKYSRLRFWTPQMCRSELSEIVLFVRFPDMSRKSRNLKNLQKLSDLAKIVRSAKICKNLQNLEKIDFLALWHGPYGSAKNCKNLNFSALWRICPDLRKICPDTKFCKILQIPDIRKSAKKVENLRVTFSQKIENSVLYAVARDHRGPRHTAFSGGKKSDDFQHFLRVKAKNVPFSAILTCFAVRRFFSKSRRFEGQCQRDLPKGSPSCPVIFHQGGN